MFIRSLDRQKLPERCGTVFDNGQELPVEDKGHNLPTGRNCRWDEGLACVVRLFQLHSTPAGCLAGEGGGSVSGIGAL